MHCPNDGTTDFPNPTTDSLSPTTDSLSLYTSSPNGLWASFLSFDDRRELSPKG